MSDYHDTSDAPTDDQGQVDPGFTVSVPETDHTADVDDAYLAYGVMDEALPTYETAPADDLNAALEYAQHLIDEPYDHPALQGLEGLEQTVDQIAGPEAISGVLGQPYTPGQTLDDVMWQQLGMPNGYSDLTAFINAQYASIDQLAQQYDPGLSAPVPGYEQFYGPLGLQTGSGVPLTTLGDNSWMGASMPSIASILGPYENVIYPKS